MSRVLVVDDDPQVVEGLLSFFEFEEIDAAGAYDREAAEALVAGEFFPVILADLRLQCDEDGMRLLESIRRISPRSRVATMTGMVDVDEARLRELGASLVLRKPFGADEIVAIVRDLLIEIESTLTSDAEEDYAAANRVLYSIALRRYNLAREDAEELVQETWCLYLQQRATIRNPRPWLAGTISNLCRRVIQEKYRQRDRAVRAAPPVTSVVPTDAPIVVRQALTKIDAKSRALCELIGMEQFSYDEVSEQLAIPIGSVGPMYMRAKAKVRRALAN